MIVTEFTEKQTQLHGLKHIKWIDEQIIRQKMTASRCLHYSAVALHDSSVFWDTVDSNELKRT